jgi:hypothetical protein
VPGFELRAVDGMIEANKGLFKDIAILGNSSYDGEIFSDPLRLYNTVVTPQEFTIPAGTTAKSFPVLNSVVGKYGNTDIHRTRKTTESNTWNDGYIDPYTGNYYYYYATETVYRAYVYYNDGSAELVAHNMTRIVTGIWQGSGMPSNADVNYKVTNRVLKYRVTSTSNMKVMKLVGIPDLMPEEAGIVFTRPETVDGHLVHRLYIR